MSGDPCNRFLKDSNERFFVLELIYVFASKKITGTRIAKRKIYEKHVTHNLESVLFDTDKVLTDPLDV